MLRSDQPKQSRGGRLAPPIRVIGLGDGERLSIAADQADRLFGGARHLGQVDTPLPKQPWASPFIDNRTVLAAARRAGQRLIVLASGDPLCFGVGATLIDWFGADAVRVEPAPSAFALGCAALGWAQTSVQLVTAHGRALDQLHPALHHRARLIVLGDGETAVALSAMLQRLGLGASQITALSHLGGPNQVIAHHALDSTARYPALSCYGVECLASAGAAAVLPLGPGLPDALFEHDGTMTKREVRAVSVAKLAPRNAQVLWDIGTGNGSIAIEWARLAPHGEVFGLDSRQDRLARARANAARLAGPCQPQFAQGKAPAGIPDHWPQPDAIFCGGGVGQLGLLDALWQQLSASGGRLVANAVTLEGEAALLAFYARHGGNLVRLNLAHAQAVGPLMGWKPQMPILQYEGVKQ